LFVFFLSFAKAGSCGDVFGGAIIVLPLIDLFVNIP